MYYYNYVWFVRCNQLWGHPFITSTRRGRGQAQVDRGGWGQAPCGCPHRKLKLESTDVIPVFSCKEVGRPQGGGGPAHVDRGKGGQKPDYFVDVINGWPLPLLLQVFLTKNLVFLYSALSLSKYNFVFQNKSLACSGVARPGVTRCG